MTTSNDSYNWNGMIASAQQHNQKAMQQLAEYLCVVFEIDPDRDNIAPFLCGSLNHSNLESVRQWVEIYLSSNEMLPRDVDLHQCTNEFQEHLVQRLPSHMISGGL